MQQDTSWKVRKAAIKILRNLLHVKEDTDFAVEITRGTFDKILPLIKHVDEYVNEDLYEYTLDLIPYLNDVFQGDAAQKAQLILKNLLEFSKKAVDQLLLKLLENNIEKLASVQPAVLDKYIGGLISTVATRLKSKDLSFEGRIALIGCVQAALTAASKPTAEKVGPDVFALFDKVKLTKESLASYELISALFKILHAHGITTLNDKIGESCEDLVDAANAKVELKVKKVLIEAFGPLISLRQIIGVKRLGKILETIETSLSLEALHFSCIGALESFGTQGSIQGNEAINRTMNSIIQKLLDLFTTKNKIYQVSIVRVLEAIHTDSNLKITPENQKAILVAFTGLLEKCDISTVKILSNFLLTFDKTYIGFGPEIAKAITTMRSLISNADDSFLQTLVSIHQRFIPQADYLKTVYSIFESSKKDPNSDTAQASLFLYFLFETLPDTNTIVQEIVDEITSKRTSNICLNLSLLAHLGYSKNFGKEDRLISSVISSTKSAEAQVKLAAIKCLTGLAIANLESFRQIFSDHIENNVETRMFFFNSVQVLFDYLSSKAPKDAPKKFLDYLLTFVEKIEDSERAELFKAIGKVLCKDASLIDSVFKNISSSSKPIYKVMGAFICRQIFDKHLDLDTYPVARDVLLAAVNSSDPDVETAAFVTLDAVHSANAKSVEKLLNMQFCNQMAQKMLANQALVEKVEMGLFSHKIDNGLSLRRACFSFLFRLCKSERFNIHPFLEAVVAGVGDENEDVKYLATRVIRERIIAPGHAFLLLDHAQTLATNLEKSLKVFKLKSATIVQEKGSNYQALKNIVGLIQDIARSSEFSSYSQFKALESDVLNNTSFKEVLAA